MVAAIEPFWKWKYSSSIPIHLFKFRSSADQFFKILKTFLKIHNFLLINPSEIYILFVSILIGQYGQ